MNVLLISILLIVLAAIIYISIHKKASAKKEKKVTNPTSESTKNPAQVDRIKSIPEPEPESKSEQAEPVVSIKYTTTTGEDEFYKLKLKDPRWIQLSKKIKARDKYKCVECDSDGGGIVVLESIEDLEPLVDFPEVYKIVKEIFETKNELISELETDMVQRQLMRTFEAGEFSENSIYVYQDTKYNNNIAINTYIHTDAFSTNFFSFASTSSTELQSINFNRKWIDIDLLPFKKKDSIGTGGSILVEFVKEGDSKNTLLLRSTMDYNNSVYYRGQGILTYNGLSIIFPLYSLDKKQALNVHHKVYYENSEPWDFEEPYSELITLCHKCHMEAHKHPIPVKRRNSTGSTDANR